MNNICGRKGLENQRKYKRWQLSKPLKIIDRKDGRHIGNITDITIAGVGMISKYPLISNVTLELKIDLSNEDNHFNDIELEGKNVWCDKNEIIDRYNAGIELENVNEELEKQIKDLIARFGFIK